MPEPVTICLCYVYLPFGGESFLSGCFFCMSSVQGGTMPTDTDEERSAVWWDDAALAHKFLRNWAKAYALGREGLRYAIEEMTEPRLLAVNPAGL